MQTVQNAMNVLTIFIEPGTDAFCSFLVMVFVLDSLKFNLFKLVVSCFVTAPRAATTIGIVSNLYSRKIRFISPIRGIHTFSFQDVLALMFVSRGALTSTTTHFFSLISQMTMSGLLCSTSVGKLIGVFHQISLVPILVTAGGFLMYITYAKNPSSTISSACVKPIYVTLGMETSSHG